MALLVAIIITVVSAEHWVINANDDSGITTECLPDDMNIADSIVCCDSTGHGWWQASTGVTYQEANQACSGANLRMCTTEDVQVFPDSLSESNRVVWTGSACSGRYFVVKGRPNTGCSENSCDTVDADPVDEYPVRCCSDSAIAGWDDMSDREPGVCSNWAAADIWDRCQELNWADANDFCTSQGGRLCTREEMEQGCARSTGCSFDSRLVWTSTPLAPVATPEPTATASEPTTPQDVTYVFSDVNEGCGPGFEVVNDETECYNAYDILADSRVSSWMWSGVKTSGTRDGIPQCSVHVADGSHEGTYDLNFKTDLVDSTNYLTDQGYIRICKRITGDVTYSAVMWDRTTSSRQYCGDTGSVSDTSEIIACTSSHEVKYLALTGLENTGDCARAVLKDTDCGVYFSTTTPIGESSDSHQSLLENSLYHCFCYTTGTTLEEVQERSTSATHAATVYGVFQVNNPEFDVHVHQMSAWLNFPSCNSEDGCVLESDISKELCVHEECNDRDMRDIASCYMAALQDEDCSEVFSVSDPYFNLDCRCLLKNRDLESSMLHGESFGMPGVCYRVLKHNTPVYQIIHENHVLTANQKTLCSGEEQCAQRRMGTDAGCALAVQQDRDCSSVFHTAWPWKNSHCNCLTQGQEDSLESSVTTFSAFTPHKIMRLQPLPFSA